MFGYSARLATQAPAQQKPVDPTKDERFFAGLTTATTGVMPMLQGVASYLGAQKVAGQLEDRGDLAMRLANMEARRIRRDRNRRQGRLVSAQSASGFQIGTGSNLELLVDEAFEAATDVGMQRLEGRIAKRDFQMEAAQAKAKGMASLIGGFSSGFASMVPKK